MDIDPKALVAGIKPSILKALLRKERFDTPDAMKLLGLPEPDITSTLIELENGRWIRFLGNEDSVDCWSTDEKGTRLTATRLLKRIPMREGRLILQRLVDEARAINAEPQASRRVQRVLLFGSLLTGGRDGTVGDVDVVVSLKRRNIPDTQLQTLERAERSAESRRLNFIDSLCWPDTRVSRRLGRISRYISLHGETDLQATGAAFQEVYSYDVEGECELTPMPGTHTMPIAEKPSDIKLAAEIRNPRPTRKWPPAPSASTWVEISDENGRLAQHLWMSQLSVDAIAQRIHSDPSVVQGYLASRADRRIQLPTEGNSSLSRALLGAVPGKRDYVVLCTVSFRTGDEVTVDCTISKRDDGHPIARTRRVGRRFRILGAPAQLVMTLENLDRAAYAWFDTAQNRLKGLGSDITAVCLPDDEPPAETDRATQVDLRPLREPMLALFASILPKRKGELDHWDARLMVKLTSRPVVTLERGYNDPKPRVIRGALVNEVTRIARSIFESFPASSKREAWHAQVDGRMLEDSG